MPIVNIPLSLYIKQHAKRFWSLAFIAKSLNLMVAKQEHLRDQLIGLDRIKRKLLLLRKRKNRVDCLVVDLQDVQQVSVKKTYGSIPAGALGANGLSHYLQSISMRFGFKSGRQPLSINFYESGFDSSENLSILEGAAQEWKQFVAELLPKAPLLARA